MEALKNEAGESLNNVNENIETLKAILPDAFTEDGIDFEVLRQLLGDDVADSEEKYGLVWHGKKKARQIALTPSTGTLRPDQSLSQNWNDTNNIFIEGDNLEVLKLLQRSYANNVKMIYIDPPYNTGNDYIYPDNFQDNLDTYLKYSGQKSQNGSLIRSNVENSGRFHTNWLNMIYPRLKLAKGLLSDNGVIFISIDDGEVANLRMVCDEIFGETNFVSTFVRRRRMATGMRETAVSPDHEYVLAYAKRIEYLELFGFERKPEDFPLSDDISAYRSTDLTVGMTKEMRPGQFYEIKNPGTGSRYLPPNERVWRFEPNTMASHISDDNIIWPEDNPSGRMTRPRFKTRYRPDDKKTNPISTWISVRSNTGEEQKGLVSGLNQEGTKQVRELFGEQILEYPKPISLIKGLISIATRQDDIVLDFFAGSATTGHAVWEANVRDKTDRRFILVQLPQLTQHETYKTISEFSVERLKRSAAKISKDHLGYDGDLGFKVFKLDSSNIRAWNPDSSDLEQTLLDQAEHIVEGRSEQDVLYELLLKRGVDLTAPIEEREITGKTVYSIGYGVLLACLEETIDKAEIETLGQGITDWHRELETAAETQVVFRDSAFADDIAKTNMAAILEQNGIAHVRSL